MVRPICTSSLCISVDRWIEETRPIDGFFPQRKLREWMESGAQKTMHRGGGGGKTKEEAGLGYCGRKFLSARLDTATAALVAASPRLSRDIVVLLVYFPPRDGQREFRERLRDLKRSVAERTNKAGWEWRFDVCIMWIARRVRLSCGSKYEVSTEE